MKPQKFKKFIAGSKFVVAGSFRKKSKYAYQILLKLLNKDKQVYPVNPAMNMVEGLKVYKTIRDIPGIPDSASLVTPPRVTEKLVGECYEKGIQNIWMQPGAESENAIQYCKDKEINVISNACILLDG